MRKSNGCFTRWFDEESGYSLHSGHIPSRKLVYSCCGRTPEKSLLKAAAQDNEGKTLYCCPVCKRWFFREKNGYYPAGSLLQYRVEEEEETDASY